MNFKGSRSCALTLMATVVLMACAVTAHAQKTWTGNAGTTSWHDDDNWNPVGVPGLRDDVTISGAVTVVHSVGETIVNSIALTSGSATLTLKGGTLSATSSFSIGSGTLNYLGGAIGAASADPLVNGGDLFIGPAATAPAQFLMRGSTSLDGQIHPGQTVWVQGTNQHATLNIAPGAQNAGTIRLENITSTAGSNLSIPSDKGNEFVNLTSGVIEANAGTGGSRNILGDGDIVNHGLITVEEGVTMTISGSGRTLHQAGGSIVADGVFQMSGSASSFLFTGGAISGMVICNGPSIEVTDAVSESSTLMVRGALSTLINNDSPATTIWVQGTNQHATLNIAPGAQNAGTIRLENITSTASSNLSIPSGKGEEFVILPTGVIEANVGTGGTRNIFGDGDLINHGLIAIEKGALLSVPGSNRTVHQAAGSIVADGEFRMTAGGSLPGSTFLFTGGGLSGDVVCDNPSIDVRDTVVETSTIMVRGTLSTLINNDSPATTIWVQGTNLNATLNIAPGAQNAGTIRLENVTSTAGSNLSIPSGESLVNLETGLIEAKPGTGGSRSIFGSNATLVNEGILDAGYPNSLTISGNYTQTATGVFITEFAGASAGEFSHLIVNGDAQLAGTIELTRVDEYVPDAKTGHPVIDAGSLTGAFQVFSTCDDVSIDYTDSQAIVFFDVSDIVGDLTNSGSVGVPDLLILLAGWGVCPAGEGECCPADLTGSGTVGVPDLLLLLANWG